MIIWHLPITTIKLPNLARCCARTRAAEVKTNSLTSPNVLCMCPRSLNSTVTTYSTREQCWIERLDARSADYLPAVGCVWCKTPVLSTYCQRPTRFHHGTSVSSRRRHIVIAAAVPECCPQHLPLPAVNLLATVSYRDSASNTRNFRLALWLSGVFNIFFDTSLHVLVFNRNVIHLWNIMISMTVYYVSHVKVTGLKFASACFLFLLDMTLCSV